MANEFVARNGIIALSNSIITGSLDITGNLTTTGTITAQKLVVQQVTSSVVYSSGSNVFGNDLSNTQTMTGSVNISGSLTATGIATFDSNVVAANSYNLSTDGVYQWTNSGNRVQMSATNGTWTLSTGILSYNPIITATSGGNVGIGTTSPTSMLHAKASGYPTLTLEGGTNAGSGIRFFGDVQYAEMFGEYESANNGQLFFRTRRAGTIVNAMTITSGGNVGIGTTSPQSGVVLDVRGGAAVAGGSEGLRIGYVGDNSAYDNVKLWYTGFNSAAPRIFLTPRTQPGSGVINTFLHLLNANGSSSVSNNTMGLIVDGNVGIGTTSFSDVAFGSSILKIAGSRATLGLNSTGTLTTIALVASNDTTKAIHINQESNGALKIYQYSAAAETFTMTPNGNVLIGTTTDNGAKLQVNGGVFISGFTSNVLSNHGEKFISLSGPNSVHSFDVASEFPSLSISGNVLGVTMLITIFGSGGSVYTAIATIARNSSGTWASYGLTASSSTVSLLQSVTGSGTTITINTNAGSYVGVKVTAITQ